MSGQAAHRLDPAGHGWMTAPETRAVMEALNGPGGDRARFVGGCVRNALIGAPVDDVDIATVLEPGQSTAKLEAAGIKVIPTGVEHGTVTAVCGGKPFEVTSLRKDVETFGRRAVVAFTTNWEEDAGRRDFRLNAIYARADGTLFDPFGGVEDARAGRVVFIGRAEDRIAEDHLRILRFYRFTAWYGRAIDPDGHVACVAMRETLHGLSAERVWRELKKLLAAPDPRAAVRAMLEGHILNEVLPGRVDFNLFAGIINADRGKNRAADPLLRLVALLGRDEDATASMMAVMKTSKAETARTEAMTGPAEAVPSGALRPGMTPALRNRALYALGADAVIARLRLDEAEGLGSADADIEAAGVWTRPRFPVKGKDLIALGYAPGPALGEALARLEAEWIESGFTLDKASLLARAGGGA